MSPRVVTWLIAFGVVAHLCLKVGGQSAAAQPPPRRAIAVTFDDLPLNGPPLDLPRLQAMTTRLLAAVARHKIPVVGFVNESQLYVPGEFDARVNLLKQWVDAGAELGNHTFSHLNFKGASLVAYQDDVVRGDTVTRMIMKERGARVRFFRHPFLQMGETRELEESFERFLAERGYRMAPITVDSMDWLVLNAYNKARASSSEALKRVATEYLNFAAEQLAFSEKVAADLFGRRIKHILLLHANELNADTFDALVERMKGSGYEFITVEEALSDEAYRYPDSYVATSQWLALRAADQGLKISPPRPPESLR